MVKGLLQISTLKLNFFFLFILHILSFDSFSNQRNYIKLNKDSADISILIDSIRRISDTNYIYAYEIAIKGLKDYKNCNNVMDRIRLLQLTAEIEFNYKSQFEKSIEHLNEMKELSDSINFKGGKPWVQLNMANLYYVQKDFYKSMKLYKEAKKNALLANDSIIVINAINGIAGIFHLQKKNDSALMLLHQCRLFAEKKNIFDSQYYIYEDLATIHRNLNNLDSSIYYYKELFDLSTEKNNLSQKLKSKANLIYLQHLKDHTFNPISNLTTIQKQCKENKLFRLYYEIGYILSDIFESYQMCNEAFSSYKEARIIEDSLTANEKIRKVAEIESNYYLEKKEFENRELNKLNQINSLKLKNRRNLIAFILFILFQAIILLYLLYRKYVTIKEQERKIYDQENEKITQKLDSKKRELAINTLKMYHANQLIDDLSIKLFKLRSKIRTKGKAAEELRSDIQLMLNEIRSNANSKIWEEVELSFNEANPNFMKWLNSNFPNLTSNEIKLCIFSLLHLKTKDMSSILMKSNMSVQVARTRLRKKLMINDQNISLSGFLSRKYEEEN